MKTTHVLPALVAALLVGIGGCRADREAVEDVPLDKNEAIEEAPAAPIPPIGVPVGVAPDTGAVTTVDLDTIAGGDTLR